MADSLRPWAGIIGPDPHPSSALAVPVPSAGSSRSPWGSPQYVPGTPQSLPAPGDRIAPRTANLLGRAGGASLSNPAVANQITRDPHRYAQVIEIPLTLPADTSTQVLTFPTGLRNFLMFRCVQQSSSGVYISLGTQAGLQSVIYLTDNQMMLFDTVVPQTEVFAYAADDQALLITAFANYTPNL